MNLQHDPALKDAASDSAPAASAGAPAADDRIIPFFGIRIDVGSLRSVGSFSIHGDSPAK